MLASSSRPSRRTAFCALTGAALAAAAASGKESRLSMEGYIFMNMANRAKRPLVEMMDELFASAPYGGFRNVELNDGFFTPAVKDKTFALLDQHKLRMPSVYVGGVMHQDDLADKTIEKALTIAAACKPYGCTAVVHNPNPKPKGAAKDPAELDRQAANLNRMTKALAGAGFELRAHHHNPELEDNAREWRHILKNTSAKLCIDVEFVYRAGIEPSALIREAGQRVTELHLRNRTNNSPLQDFGPGDIDYSAVAKTLREMKLKPLIVVELAYHDDTVITRSFNDNVRQSRLYAEKVFAL
jgi:sugar phosphate isomerase/epimerase